MESVFARTPGVGRFCREGDGVIIENDAKRISPDQLLDIFRTLPSFYQGFFIPTLVTLQP
jgi:hypothetical protein